MWDDVSEESFDLTDEFTSITITNGTVTFGNIYGTVSGEFVSDDLYVDLTTNGLTDVTHEYRLSIN